MNQEKSKRNDGKGNKGKWVFNLSLKHNLFFPYMNTSEGVEE